MSKQDLQNIKRTMDLFQAECLSGNTLVGLGLARNNLSWAIKRLVNEQDMKDFNRIFSMDIAPEETKEK